MLLDLREIVYFRTQKRKYCIYELLQECLSQNIAAWVEIV